MNREQMKERLATLIIEKEALKFGDFTLASGKKSDYYIDGRIISQQPEGSYLIGKIIHSILVEKYPSAEAVGGLVIGAVPVSSSVAQASHDTGHPIDSFMIRKEAKGHGTQKFIEGPLKPGQKVVVLDDVMTTGGSTIKAVHKIIDFGCEVLGLISVVDREEQKVEEFGNYEYTPVLTISELRNYRHG